MRETTAPKLYKYVYKIIVIYLKVDKKLEHRGVKDIFEDKLELG